MFRSVTHQMRVLADVLSGANKLADHFASLIEPVLAEYSEVLRALPEKWFAAFQLGLLAWLEHERGDVLEAEREQRKADRAWRSSLDDRDDARATLLGLLVGTRQFTEGALGRGTSAQKLGLDPNLHVHENGVLLRYGSECHKMLEAGEFPLSTVIIDGREWSVEEFAATLGNAVTGLEELDAQARAQQRVAEAAQLVKEERTEALGRRVRHFARAIEELYAALGLKVEASRLRRARPRRSSRGEPLPDAADDDDATEVFGPPGQADAGTDGESGDGQEAGA